MSAYPGVCQSSLGAGRVIWVATRLSKSSRKDAGGAAAAVAGTAPGTILGVATLPLAVSSRPDNVSVCVDRSTILERFAAEAGLMGAATRFLAGALAFDTNPDVADAGRDTAALFAANGEGSSS